MFFKCIKPIIGPDKLLFEVTLKNTFSKYVRQSATTFPFYRSISSEAQSLLMCVFCFLVVHFHLFHFCDLTHPCGMFSFLREKEKENWFIARAKSEVLQNTQQDAQCWGFEFLNQRAWNWWFWGPDFSKISQVLDLELNFRLVHPKKAGEQREMQKHVFQQATGK